MSKRTLHAAFGHVIARNEFSRAETLVVDTNSAVRSHIFYTVGRFSWVEVESGERTVDCDAGVFIAGKDSLAGIFKGEALDEPSVFFCVDPKINRDYLPDVQPIAINEPKDLPAKTKLFLCSGTVQVKGQLIKAPAQIKLESNSEVVPVEGVAYGLLFL